MNETSYICGNCRSWACRSWGGNTNLLSGLCARDGSIRGIGEWCGRFAVKKPLWYSLVMAAFYLLIVTGIAGTIGFFLFLAWRAGVTA